MADCFLLDAASPSTDMPAALADAEIPRVITDFLRYAADKANFPGGIVLGIGLALLAHLLAGIGRNKERLRQMELDSEREKELRSQLNLKDERISALHKELEKHLKHRK